MESPPRTPVQPMLTAFFPNAHSRSAPRMGKGGGASAAKKNALLSQQKISADSEPNNNSSGSGSELQECITTPAKQASRASAAAAAAASAGRKRSMTDKTTKTTAAAASKAKRTRTATTTKRQTSVARSLSISFGPKAVSRLDFSAQSTTTTTTTSSVQEIEQEKEKEEGSTITSATTAKTLITEVSSSSSSSPSKAPASSSSSEQPTTTTTTTTSTLNIAAVKERLKSCKSLAQLKSNLSSFNNCAEQLKEFKSMKVQLLSPVKSAYVSPSKRSSAFASPEKLSLSGLTMIPSPLKATANGKVPAIPSKLTSSPFLVNRRAAQEAVAQMPAKLSCSRKLFEEEEEAQEDGENSNNNSTTTMPAHSRFSHLAMPATTPKSSSSSPSPPPSTEPELPLPSKFTHLLNVFTHMDFIVSRSKETVTFERLKAKVELATRRTFDRPMLAKVLTVLAIEEKQWFKLKSELLRGSSQLIISAAAVDEQVDEQTSTSCLNSYQRLLLRKTAFAKMLLEITKRRHLHFLASVGLTATLSPEKTMFKWHPLFKLDEVDLVPDMSLLPEEKKAVVNNANSILNYFVPVSKTAEAAKAKEAAAEKAAAAATPSPTSTPSKKDVRVKGIRPDLLAKVREKEAARKARLMFRTPETDRKLRLLEQTEPAVRIIASLFTSTAARSFPREKVVKVLADSMKVTSASADALLTYLLSLELLADPTDLDRRWLRPHTSLSDGVSSYIVLQASPRLAFLKEQIARKIAAIKSSD